MCVIASSAMFTPPWSTLLIPMMKPPASFCARAAPSLPSAPAEGERVRVREIIERMRCRDGSLGVNQECEREKEKGGRVKEREREREEKATY